MTLHRIYVTEPIHCPITDGQIGSRTTPLPMAYRSARLARKLAALMDRADSESGGDASYRAGPADPAEHFRRGRHNWLTHQWGTAETVGECPF